MHTRSYSIHKISGKLFLLILVAFISEAAWAQYIPSPAKLVTPATTPGNYYNETSITLSPGFSATATSTSSYRYFIQVGCSPLGTNPSQNQNYILTSVPRESGIDPAGNNTNCKLMQTVQYFDGLGRPLQTVQVKGAPSGNDIVQPVAYDQFGRESIKYLHYAITTGSSDGSYKSDALTVQKQFYNGPPTGVNRIDYPLASTGFEASPLNRVVEQGAPGGPWQLSTTGVTGSGHTVQVAYGSNATGEVIQWTVNATGTGATGTTNYGVNQLYKTTTTDENGNNTIEYEDKKGHVVCKKVQSGVSTYLATYYVYDDFDNLSYVIPPIPSGTAYPASFTEADAVFVNFIYGYHYDERNRLNKKKIPGKGWEYIVYNQFDQVVLTQDAVQRTKSPQEWTLTKYDGQGREILTGQFKDTSPTPLTMAQLQANIYAAPQFETRINGSLGYTLSSYPGLSWVFTLNYYDDYNFPGNNPYQSTVSGTLAQPTGLLTATKTAVLSSDGTFGPMLWSVHYYDDRGRVAQTYQQHYLGEVISNGNYDVTTFSYNFNDQDTSSVRKHYTYTGTTAALTVNNTYHYDHMGRKTQTLEQINNGPNVLLSQNDYNEIGQLMTKHLHGVNGSAPFLQDINYTYNERGWLSSINDPAVAATTAKYFAEKINYNSTQYGGQPQYNGNIAEQAYRAYNPVQPPMQTVIYKYNSLNQLTDGNGSAGFSETGISYDELGNLKKLTRNGMGALSYDTYTGNRLMSISGYKSGTYGYDDNGNMTGDGQRSAVIQYNRIDLPRKAAAPGIDISYTYMITGEKLRKVSNGVSTDYISGIQYKPDGTIDFVQTEEGRANRSGTNYVYEYTLTDHLGNNRVTFDQTNGKVGEEDYYPFGLNVPRQINAGNKYLYNKKELQEELNQYDYGARFYDPVIGRWTTVDPSAEDGDQESLTPYQYGLNNPIKNTDPDGKCPSCFIGALVGAAVDYGEQVTANYIEGKANPWTNNINLVSIGTSAVAGFVTSGGSAIESVGAKLAVKAGASLINNTVKVTTSSTGLKTEVETNAVNVVKNTAIDLAADKIAGKVGGKVEGALSKVGVTNAGRLSSTARAAVRATGNNVTRATTATVKAGLKAATAVATQTVESGVKAAANSKVDELKTKTNQQ